MAGSVPWKNSQNFQFGYEEDLKSSDFNKLYDGVIPYGFLDIISNITLTGATYPNQSINIPSFTVIIKGKLSGDSDEITAKVKTSVSEPIAINTVALRDSIFGSSHNKFLVLRFNLNNYWSDSANNYINWDFVSKAGIDDSENLGKFIVVCKLITEDGSYSILDLDTNYQTISPLKQLEDFRDNFKIQTKLDASSDETDSIEITGGNAFINSKYVVVANQNIAVPSKTGALGRYDLVCIDDTGSLYIEEGVESATPILPNFPMDKLVIGKIERESGDDDSIVYGTQITNFEYSKLTNGNVDINSLAEKTSVVNADEVLIKDSDDTYNPKKVLYSTIKCDIQDINTLDEKTSIVNADEVLINDSADSYNPKKITIETVRGFTDLTEKTSIVNADEVLINDSADSYNPKKITIETIQDFVINYDYMIDSQTDFDTVFTGTIAEGTSIFLKKTGTDYLLNNVVTIGNKVIIHSDGAIVKRGNATAKFQTTYKGSGVVSGTEAIGQTIITLNAGHTIEVGDLIKSSLSETTAVTPYRVVDVSGNDITLDKAITIAFTGGTLYSFSENIDLKGWYFDGQGGVNGLGGSYTSIAVGGFATLNWVANSNFEVNVYNCYVSNGGGAYYSNSTTSLLKIFNNNIKNISNCTAGNQGGGCYACNYSIISNISNCTAGAGAGCYACNYSTISNISNCTAGV
ncbi:MAG: hypothetical protein WDK95_11660, partial [Syntrophorhabdaceae bacterium]